MGNPKFDEFEGRRRKRHLKKAKFPGFEQCLEMMRSHDGEQRDDGFWWLAQQASQLVNELIAACDVKDNLGLRSGIMELIAAAKSLDAFPFLARQLRSDDWVVRKYAIDGLKRLDTKEARSMLWEARSFELKTREDTEWFRKQLDAPESFFMH